MCLPGTDFTNPSYLSAGNERQRKAYELLMRLQIFDALKEFSPVLAGTIPIDIDLPESDLDIICEVYDFDRFEAIAASKYGMETNYKCSRKIVGGLTRTVIHFTSNGWPIEIFAQSIPTLDQNGYKHMVIEHRILNILGNTAHGHIRNLKRSGLKTEPAFAYRLKLHGDPFQSLLEMYDWSEDELIHYLTVNSIEVF